MSVLLVNAMGRDDSLETALTLAGMRVVGCRDAETLEGLLDESWSLVVIFVSSRMESAMIETIRERYKVGQLPIVALAADDAWNEALEAGANLVLPENRPLAQLVALIQRRRAEHESMRGLKRQKERFQRALEGSRDGLWDWDLSSNRVFYSWEWRMLMGLPPGDRLNHPDDWFRLVHPDDMSTLRSRLAVHIEGVTPYFECQCRMLTLGTKYKWILCRGMAARDEQGKATRLTGTVTDLSDRSHHDIRTGLPFRSFFVERLSAAIVLCQLGANQVYSVLQVDVDRFTTISEGFGHDMVDQLLIAFARRVETCLRAGDTLAFLGGSSFVILLEDTEDMKSAKEVANQIHMQLIAPFRINDTDVFSKASIGITRVNGKINNPNELLRQAHGAMKAARKMGSGQTQVFDSAMASRVHEYLKIESGLRSALDNQEFELHYQPQIHLATGKIIGVETLLRWRDDGRFISPGKFIPVAEETDLILTIGEWVLRTACQQSVAWQRKGLPPLRMAVNLSERQFRARNLVGMVDQTLRETGLSPELLELEITESIFMEDVENTFNILKSLRERGVKIALDDFGTGFSSLSYLKRFPLTALKIDRAFVTDLTCDAGDAAICASIISLAHKFKFSVIAEGVENREQLMILRAFQCDEIQGFYFSKALPANELEVLLQKQAENVPIEGWN